MNGNTLGSTEKIMQPVDKIMLKMQVDSTISQVKVTSVPLYVSIYMSWPISGLTIELLTCTTRRLYGNFWEN
jgi:hypothetical protein